ncbi:MAG: hypothetical protein PUP91_36735 [Rhizonema sp. PD37]|nr:hypothetical protein [Rhizonema sp. PD37]
MPKAIAQFPSAFLLAYFAIFVNPFLLKLKQATTEHIRLAEVVKEIDAVVKADPKLKFKAIVA